MAPAPPKKTTAATDKTDKSTKRPRSPGRGETKERRGTSKSPGRTKSPSRISRPKPEPSPDRSKARKSTDLSKSPTRSTRSGRLTPSRRSPIRSSPSRFNKEQEGSRSSSAKESSAIPILTKKKKVVELDTDSDTADEKIEIKEKPKAAVRGRTRVNLVEKVDEEKEGPRTTPTPSSRLVVKRVTRSQQKEVERIVHLRHFEPEAAKKLSEFSDEDVEFVRESSIPPKTSRSGSGSASLTEVLILLTGLPLYGLYLFNVCSGKQCSFIKTPEEINFTLSYYFDLKSILGYLSCILILTILSALPFGGWKVTALPDKNGKFVYVTNGLFSAVFFLANAAALEYFEIPVLRYIVDHLLHLYVAALLTGVFFTVLTYIKSFYVPVSALNPQIVNRNKLYNFVMGRELHPRIFRVIDLKMLVYKTLAITELLIYTAYLYQSFQATKNPEVVDEEITERLLRLSPTVLVYSSLQLIRLFDRLFYETSWITSKGIQQEGFGFDTGVNYFLYPFISSFTVKYIVEQRVELAYWKLGLISVVYLIGHTMARTSDNLKDAFRKNPYSSNFSRLTTIPTNQGKKLLASGLWGFVRHPNYLGSIISELATVPFVACAPPVILRWFNVLFLINRARVDNAQCQQKYGMAWDRYCNRVRYLLVPKVY